jgi:threonine synthase
MAAPDSSLRINPNIKRLRCSASGQEIEAGFERPIGLCSCCPAPGKPVVVEYHLDRVGEGRTTETPGIWRYASLLPVAGVPDYYASDVGDTPVVSEPYLGDEIGVELYLKNEGSNPSGSFKDRGLAVAIALGRACGAERFCLPTQGNAGVAASLFSARLGLPGALVYMPEGYQDGIYHREAVLFGAEVRFAEANIAACGRQMREDVAAELASGAFVDMSTFFEPGRLEGKKTMGLEIFDHFGADALPDFILYPTGGGTGLVGIWKAFQELIGLGRIDPERHHLPAMVAVQSEQCAPVIRSFERGLTEVEPVTSEGTVADGLDVPGAIMGHGMLSTIRDSHGTAAAVAEHEIIAAFRDCGRRGIATSYEGAALLAALRKLRHSGAIAEGSRVLLLLTATHLIPVGKREVHGL